MLSSQNSSQKNISFFVYSFVNMSILNCCYLIFLQETIHEDVVPQCLNSEEIKNKVVNFMAKVCC